MTGGRCALSAVALFAALVAAPAPLRAQLEPLPERMAVADERIEAAPDAVLLPPPGLAQPAEVSPVVDPAYVVQPPVAAYVPGDVWTWQLIPSSLIYRSYLAGVKEPRFGGLYAHEKDRGAFVDGIAGARIGIIRLGTQSELFPQGYQLDVEGGTFLRFDAEEELDMDTADYRLGVPLTYGFGRLQTKLAWYHLSSHLADEFLIKHPATPRINYSRDAIVLGFSYYVTDDLRVYVETGYAYYNAGGSEPWEFQFGFDFSPLHAIGPLGAPFFAINGHLREEVDFGGEFVVQGGWQWRSRPAGGLLRIGVQYFNGHNDQYQFFTTSEQQIGGGIWYDF